MTFPEKFDTITLPPSYSPEHQEAREKIMLEMDELQREMRERSRPLLDMLSEIDACYAPRYIIVPK
jgi:hypothetical protein